VPCDTHDNDHWLLLEGEHIKVGKNQSQKSSSPWGWLPFWPVRIELLGNVHEELN
jgi:hypothetical protein